LSVAGRREEKNKGVYPLGIKTTKTGFTLIQPASGKRTTRGKLFKRSRRKKAAWVER